VLIFEIEGVPSAILAVQDIDGPGLRISGHKQEQQNRRRQFNPANDFDVLGNLYGCGYRCLQIDFGPSCTTGSAIIRPNISVIFSGQSAHVALC
jgi:hypothetical protein